MKSKQILLLAISLIIIFTILTGCQHNYAPAVKEADKTVQDYNKLFELELYSDKQLYKTTDKISIWATLKYIGSDSQVKIWHGNPYISFSISDGKKFKIESIIEEMLTSTILEKEKLYRFDYFKSGGFSNDDPDADFWKKFFEGKDLYLPEGEYTIKVSGAFTLTENPGESKNNLSKEIKISVVK